MALCRAAASTSRDRHCYGARGYPDAPAIYLSDAKLQTIWGTGERKWIFAEDPDRSKVEGTVAGRLIPVQTFADKTLWTDRPLE